MPNNTERALKRRYDEVFDALYRYLEEKRRTDPAFTPAHVRAFLKDAYVRMGNNWIGKGTLFETTQNATIAAYETFLVNWKEERAAWEHKAVQDDESGHE